MTKMNIKALKQDLNAIAEDIKKVKAILREPHQPRKTWATIGELHGLKATATRLCCIRAHHRGKLHLKVFESLEQQAEFIGSHTEYELQEAA